MSEWVDIENSKEDTEALLYALKNDSKRRFVQANIAQSLIKISDGVNKTYEEYKTDMKDGLDDSWVTTSHLTAVDASLRIMIVAINKEVKRLSAEIKID